MIAVDTNVLVYLWLRADKTTISEKIHHYDPIWVAPLLWRSEFRNVVSLYVRRGVAFEVGLQTIEKAENQMKGNELQVSSEEVMRLAEQSGCTAYDCEFVHVAQIKSVPLVTFDRQILGRFPHIAIDPLKFIERFS
jgi:predicted nucleic acid-binding protein